MRYNFTKDSEKQGEESISVALTKKRKLDLGPRIVCFLIALAIWVYMVNLNDTDVTGTVTLNVQVVGVEELKEDANMLIYGMDKSAVTINVKGTQRDLMKYAEADYKATVNVSGIEAPGKHTLPIEVKTPTGSSITVESGEIGSVTLFSDISLTKSVPLEVIRGDMITVPTYTYEITKDADFIELTGPASMLEKIETVQYTVNGEFYSSKNFSGFALEFCDKNHDVISFESGAVTYSTAHTTILVSVRASKRIDVVVKVEGIGTDLIPMPELTYVTIHGDPTVLTQVSEYVVELSEAYVGRDATITITNDGMPEGITVENDGATFNVRFTQAPDQPTE